MTFQMPAIEHGCCECGCGTKTNPHPESRPSRGHVKGAPRRFVMGHSRSAFRPDRPNWSVDPDTGCWLWGGCINEDGYGRTNGPLGKLAHRAAYRRFVGPISDGMELDHTCRVRRCVNPEHLEPVTSLENKRRATGWTYDDDGHPLRCARGHDLTADRGIYVRPHDGRNECWTCRGSRPRSRRVAES